MLGFFRIVPACTKYKANAAENQKNKKKDAGNSKGIIKNDGNEGGKSGEGGAQRTGSPGDVANIDSIDSVHDEIIL